MDKLIRLSLRFAFALWAARNIIGLVLIAPVLYRMAQHSLAMAVWVGFSCIAGTALSLLVPLYGQRLLKRWKPQWV